MFLWTTVPNNCVKIKGVIFSPLTVEVRSTAHLQPPPTPKPYPPRFHQLTEPCTMRAYFPHSVPTSSSSHFQCLHSIRYWFKVLRPEAFTAATSA